MSTSSTSPTTFTGSSNFANDLANVVSRAVSFASLPVQQLQNQQAKLQSQQTSLQTLSSQFQSLETALDGIGSAVGSGSYSASVSNSSVLTASTGSGVMGGTYSLTVISMGSQTNTLSADGLTTVTDPSSGNIDSSSTFSLTINGQNPPVSISNPSGTLAGLAQAINQSGANVQATVVNVGSPTSPDYRLSVQSNEYAPDTIQLTDSNNNNLLNTVGGGGSYVQYQVAGASAPANSSSRNINLSTGLNVTITGAGSATVSVAQNASSIQNALSSFVRAYNSATDELAKSRGQNAGPLAGQSYVGTLTSELQNLTGYSAGSGTLQTLSDLGITFDTTGHLQFDGGAFSQAAGNSLTDLQNFLGSETSGGFLQSAENILTSINDPVNGVLPNAANDLQTELTDTANQISTDQDRVNQLQVSLTNQMDAADATIASMEQQLSYITSVFQAMQDSNKNG
jgi:flagellar hook-associated protein 2